MPLSQTTKSELLSVATVPNASVPVAGNDAPVPALSDIPSAEEGPGIA